MAEESKKPKVFDENTVWTTFDGRKIKVKDLETGHAINIVNHLAKRGFVSAKEWRYEMESFMIMEIVTGHSDAFEDDFTSSLYHGTAGKIPSRMMDAVLEELERRGVDVSKLPDGKIKPQLDLSFRDGVP